jgi:hypothetical protein
MNRRARSLIVALVVIVGGLGATGGADLAPAPARASLLAQRARSYTSPNYGYRLTWDRSWQLISEASERGVDILRLENGISETNLVGYRYAADATSCVDDFAAIVQGSGYPDLTPSEVAGGDRAYAYALYLATFAPSRTTSVPITIWIECAGLPAGDAVVTFVWFSPRDQFEQQLEPVQRLLAGLDV